VIRARVPDTPDGDHILSRGECSAFVDQGGLYNNNQSNRTDGPRMQYPYLEHKVNYRSQKSRRNYDNGRPSRQVGEYADEGQSFLHSGEGGLRVTESCQ
jgi:hypothetical protein